MSKDGMTAGMLLRHAREAAGLHVAALAVSLKVPVRKLEALEEDRYDLLTDAVFVRALSSSICRTLKVDPQPVLDRLPPTAPPRLARDIDGINANFRAPNDRTPSTWRNLMTRPLFLAVSGLLLAALVVVLLPVQENTKAETALPAAPSSPVANSPVEATVSQPLPDSADTADTATASPAVTTWIEPTPAVATAAPEPASAATAPTATPTPTPTPTAIAIGNTLIVKAKAASWVEVTDAKGIVAVRKVLAAGEAAGASGEMPLRVTIGKVDATEVEVRGRPFDLRPVSRDNVARFEVK